MSRDRARGPAHSTYVRRYCSTMRVDCLETPSPYVLSSDLISWSSLVSEGSFVTLMASMHTECIRGHVVGRSASLWQQLSTCEAFFRKLSAWAR